MRELRQFRHTWALGFKKSKQVVIKSLAPQEKEIMMIKATEKDDQS